MGIEFTKWQGCGNDFVLVDDRSESIKDPAELSRKMCDRHYGIGADGLIIIRPSDKADTRMRIYNTDGSEAEMCGNGIRCFARWVYELGLVPGEEFTVETGAGILVPKIIKENGRITGVRVDMGQPVLDAEKIPTKGFGTGRVVDKTIEVLGETYHVTCVSMGNPHCVVLWDDLSTLDIEKLGPAFENHPAFPNRVNTEFVSVRDKNHVRMRVWERGAAVTMACGTGACATLTACVLNDRTERKAEIELDGGKLFIEWSEKDNHIYMTGPAEEVYKGTYI
ncbi:MAG: diaminopimelate epimerase [Schwartzia sp.]|jgi:diaminopimelate epimerase|nr:diaminopimelate epimerase [Schwartzia sp. (in: firmicutes)]MBQ3864121.1 diaminopimelate epimerase [Schwartzia sp. (in: firmicutes)]MBQ4152553.1 diaminopimelate epimerase [Schwartzia sp. (in: firmicutes)]MBQ5414318.1 diaminopimelate epimerase [Schwartzia sp. (in: firmicutes)]